MENQDLQAFALPSIVAAILFNAGSARYSIEGVLASWSAINTYVSDVIVRRNNLGSLNGCIVDWSTGAVDIYSWQVIF